MTTDTPGEIAYAAYCRCEYGPYMARADAPLTWGWSLLLDSERAAWEAAAQAVLEQTAPYEFFIRLLSCVHAVMRKRQTGDPSMPWETIDALCTHTLEAVMGDEAYQRWQHSTMPGGGTLEEHPDA